jgi:uncharacterized membrane protein
MKVAVRILLFLLLVFLIQHFFIAAVPSLIFKVAQYRKTAPFNAVIHAGKTDAKLRKVVLPNPDFVYSACFYDLSKSDLVITGVFPDTTQYCSLAFYDNRAQPFYVFNNFKASTGSYALRLSSHKQGYNLIQSPTLQGVVLMRILATDSFQRTKALAIQKDYSVSEIPRKD